MMQMRARRLRAVRNVSLEVRRGETLALLGESGSGKSLTARAACGQLDPLIRATTGEVLLDGQDLLSMPARTRRGLLGRSIAMVFQDSLTALNPGRRVGWQIAEAFVIHGLAGRAEAHERAVDLMDRVGIPDARIRARHYPHQLSGGMRQRVLIAMAVALGPAVLIADEPTTALDVTVQAQILDLLRDLQAERNMGVLLITHDLGVVVERAERVAVMYAGSIVESGPTTEVLSHPRHPYTRALLDSVPGEDAPPGTLLRSIAGRPPNLRNVPAGCTFAPRCPLAVDDCRVERPPLVHDGPRADDRNSRS